MALSFSTGMTEISLANSITDWDAYKITSGGGTPGEVLDTDVKKQGTGCVGCVPTSGKDCGIVFDYYNDQSGVLDMTTVGNEVFGIWVMILSKAMINTFQNGGGYIIVCAANSNPTSSNKWAKWYIAGSDNFYEGWNFFMIDTRKTPSAENGGWAASDLATIYRLGAGVDAIDSWKAEWFYVDWCAYGRPIYTLEGDGTITADWADFLSDSTTAVNGLIEDVNGAYQLSCGIQFGDDLQSSTTTFDDDTGQAINFKRHTYYSSGTVDALTYSDYYKVTAEGASGSTTSITLGDLVGTDQGILGGTIKSSDAVNVPIIVDFDTDQAHISALNLYGVVWQNITGSFKIGANSAYNVFSNQFVGCSQVDPVGACEIRNSLFINTADADAALLWNDSIDIQYCSFIANTTGAGIEHPLDDNTPFSHVGHKFSGNDWDVLNSDAVAIVINNSGDPKADGSSYDPTGTAVTFETAIDIIITVQDANTDVIQYAQVGVYKTSDRTELLKAETNASGIAQTSYSGGATEIEVRVRKASSGATKYKNFSTLGNTTSSDFKLLVTLVEDSINAATS